MRALKANKKIFVNKDRNTVTVTSVVNLADFLWLDIYCTKTFSGVARLKEGDEIDIEKAKHIAESKMERSFYKYLLKEYLDKFNNMIVDIKELYKLLKKTIDAINKTDSHIKELADANGKSIRYVPRKIASLIHSADVADFIKGIDAINEKDRIRKAEIKKEKKKI